MKPSDNSEFGKYRPEAERRWSGTAAYAEYFAKTKDYTDEKFGDISAGLDKIFGRFAACMRNGSEAYGDEAQSLVLELQQYITDNFYTCTDAVLAGLGQMYVADGRFRQNIDRHGEGTAEFVSRAISYRYGNKAT